MFVADSAQIMRLMQKKNLGMYELARKAGITAATLLRTIERTSPTKIMTIFKIAEALGVDYNSLIVERASYPYSILKE